MSSAIIYVGTANQENYLQKGSGLAPAAKQDLFSSPSGLGADLLEQGTVA